MTKQELFILLKNNVGYNLCEGVFCKKYTEFYK